jgi:hypothetical protein
MGKFSPMQIANAVAKKADETERNKFKKKAAKPAAVDADDEMEDGAVEGDLPKAKPAPFAKKLKK